MIKVDCKSMANDILDQVGRVHATRSLLILHAGDDPASASYMKGKIKDCQRCGIPVKQIKVEDQGELMFVIDCANNDPCIGGIIVQLPLPEGFDEQEAVSAVRIDKDVDGFRYGSPFMPCTPEGILYVMKKELGENLAGSKVLLVGKGELVGKPLINILLDEGCTITVTHSRTKNMDRELGIWHDAVIVGVGKPNLVDLKKTNSNLIIDAGINRVDGHLVGDCFNFSDQYWWSRKYTPVPGGIGLMTRAMLMDHMKKVRG